MLNFNDAEKIFVKKITIRSGLNRINELRLLFPELKNWKNTSIYNAWNQYSKSIYMIDDAIWIKETEEAFLTYIFVRNKFKVFSFGEEGMFEDYLKEYTKKKPWLNNTGKPKWINYDFLTE